MAQSLFDSPLVSADQLAAGLDHPELIVLNATLPRIKQPLSDDASREGIHGVRNFDLKGSFCDTAAELPNTIPSPESFTQQCQKLGINQSSQIVIYDLHGIYSSPRAWWLFRVMGHTNVAVLDGGFPEWRQSGHPCGLTKTYAGEPGDFLSEFQSELFTNTANILAGLKQPNPADPAIIDARNEGRFNATTPEPRAGLRGGRIPGSSNLPMSNIIRDGKILPVEELKRIYEQLELRDKRIVFT